MCENQDKQRDFSDHWKSVKMLFLKKIMGGDSKHPIKLLNCHIKRKNYNKTTNEWTWNIFAVRFNFSKLASLVFVIYFVISSFASTNNSSKHSGVILK